MPIMTIALTSDTLSAAQVYDAADSVLAQRLSQVAGVAQVQVNGAEKPAVRVRLDPAALAAAGLSTQDIYTAIRKANVTGAGRRLRGRRARRDHRHQRPVAEGGRLPSAGGEDRVGGSNVRLGDVASVVDGVANTRLAAWFGQQPAILLTVTKTLDANVIETVDRIRAVLPLLQSWMPPDIRLTILTDRTKTIRASVNEVQFNLLIAVVLVFLVVALFMRRTIPTIAAGITVPLSLAGTLAAMWFMGFALDNFSLLALTISVGFVVDDAIVMIENIVRHMERGSPPLQAAFDGARQIGFTVMSISISLVAVFIPLLFMGGILGRLFHEFAATLTLAIAISAAVSLTLTPMLCGRFMRHTPKLGHGIPDRRGRSTGSTGAPWTPMRAAWIGRSRTIGSALVAFVATIAITLVLYVKVPKAFIPEAGYRPHHGPDDCRPQCVVRPHAASAGAGRQGDPGQSRSRHAQFADRRRERVLHRQPR